MSFGLRTKNLVKGNTTIDDSLRSYRYLGKFLIPKGLSYFPTVDFTCVGFPQIYFEVPYNVRPEDAYSDDWNKTQARAGLSIRKLQNLGGNQWRVTFVRNDLFGPTYDWYMRVFGRLDLNPLPSSGYGLRVKSPEGVLVFDSACRPLRLAGDTYDTEIRLEGNVPDKFFDSAYVAQYDTFVDVPFDLNGKSISATGRGIVYGWHGQGSHYDDGQIIYDYVLLPHYTLYWANGSRLFARRIAVNSSNIEYGAPPVVYYGNLQIVYSRLSVIDNSLFP